MTPIEIAALKKAVAAGPVIAHPDWTAKLVTGFYMNGQVECVCMDGGEEEPLSRAKLSEFYTLTPIVP